LCSVYDVLGHDVIKKEIGRRFLKAGKIPRIIRAKKCREKSIVSLGLGLKLFPFFLLQYAHGRI
jgi:hypothetical protein